MLGAGSDATAEAVGCSVTALLSLLVTPDEAVFDGLGVLLGEGWLGDVGMSKALRRKAVFRRTVISESGKRWRINICSPNKQPKWTVTF